MPSVVNGDEEIRSCMNVSSDDEMIEIISTLGLPESFTVNDWDGSLFCSLCGNHGKRLVAQTNQR